MTIVEIVPNGCWPDYIAQELWRLPWVSKKYSLRILGWLAFATAIPVIVCLAMLRRFDRGSSELLTFGWHVMAKRVSKN
jgi:hypothetical protein